MRKIDIQQAEDKLEISDFDIIRIPNIMEYITKKLNLRPGEIVLQERNVSNLSWIFTKNNQNRKFTRKDFVKVKSFLDKHAVKRN